MQLRAARISLFAELTNLNVGLIAEVGAQGADEEQGKDRQNQPAVCPDPF